MKIQHAFKAAIAAALLGAASCAMANVIQVAATGLPETSYLTAGTYQGSFNLNGAPGFPNAYTINSLSFMFKFSDDNADAFSTLVGKATGTTVSTSVVTNGQNRTATTTTTYLVPVTSTGEQESVSLTFGGLSFFGNTSAATSVADPVTTSKPAVKGNDVYVKNDTICTEAERLHDSSCKKAAFYTVEATQSTTTTTDYTGTFTLQGSLLANLLQDKALNFSFDVAGDLYLTSAFLNVDVTPQEEGGSNGNEVPEPASLALFGIALAGIAGVRRKRGA